MYGVCEQQKRAKKSVCPICSCCIKCNAPFICTDPTKHKGQRRGRPRGSNTVFNQERNVEPTNPDDFLCNSSPITGIIYEDACNTDARRNASGLTKWIANSDENVVVPDAANSLPDLFRALGLDVAALRRIPKDGAKNVVADVRELRRVKKVLNDVLDKTCDLLIQNANERQQVRRMFDGKDIKRIIANDKITKNLVQLAFLWHREVSSCCQSVLVKSMKRDEVKEVFQVSLDELPTDTRNDIAPYRKSIGQIKFSSLRRMYSLLLAGHRIPKHDYSFRIDSSKTVGAMHFLQSSLQLKPGYTRDVTVGGHTFNSIPVYERGGSTSEELFKAYKESVDTDLLVGEPTFRDMLKLLSKRGEMKAGLSTYYIRMRDFGKNFCLMMNRILEIENLRAQESVTLRIAELLEQWNDIRQFILWEYSNNHIQISSEDSIRCSAFALGGTCSHVHTSVHMCCEKCSKTISFFNDVADYITSSVIGFLNDQSYTDELQSMVGASKTCSVLLRQYLAHRLRAKVQFYAIALQKMWLKTNPKTKLLIVLDHKQKVLPMKHRESQVEYYGKQGMSLLGAMHVRWIVEDDDDGFQYTFTDYFIKGYSAQDNVQVCGCIQTMVRNIHELNPEKKEICFQSDNATCFASQELIPFVFHLNDEMHGKIRVVKWIYTEAQTGRGRLDTHFSYVNVILRSYVEDRFDTAIEDDIAKAIAHRNGIAGTAAVLINASALEGPALKKPFNCLEREVELLTRSNGV